MRNERIFLILSCQLRVWFLGQEEKNLEIVSAFKRPDLSLTVHSPQMEPTIIHHYKSTFVMGTLQARPK